MDKTHIIINSLRVFEAKDRSFHIFYLKDIPIGEKIELGDLVTLKYNNTNSKVKCVALEIGTPAYRLAAQGQGVLIARPA